MVKVVKGLVVCSDCNMMEYTVKVCVNLENIVEKCLKIILRFTDNPFCGPPCSDVIDVYRFIYRLSFQAKVNSYFLFECDLVMCNYLLIIKHYSARYSLSEFNTCLIKTLLCRLQNLKTTTTSCGDSVFRDSFKMITLLILIRLFISMKLVQFTYDASTRSIRICDKICA